MRLGGAAFIDSPPNLSVLVHWLSQNSLTAPGFGASFGANVVASVFLAPVAEEALFRFLPLELAGRFGPRVVAATQVAICMILFGWMHGSMGYIAIQGVIGLILSVLYLNNAKRHRSVLAGYTACALAHGLYNLSVLFLT
jgi:membrane protease YdiL (CAAX protease family)